MLNLVLFMYLCGPIIPIGNKNEIRGDRTVTIADLEKKIKEFHLKFYDKKIIIGKKKLSCFTSTCILVVTFGTVIAGIEDFSADYVGYIIVLIAWHLWYWYIIVN